MTEGRAVLHVALRAPRSKEIMCDGINVVPDVWEVLDKIKDFTDKVRNGSWVSNCYLLKDQSNLSKYRKGWKQLKDNIHTVRSCIR